MGKSIIEEDDEVTSIDIFESKKDLELRMLLQVETDGYFWISTIDKYNNNHTLKRTEKESALNQSSAVFKWIDAKYFTNKLSKGTKGLNFNDNELFPVFLFKDQDYGNDNESLLEKYEQQIQNERNQDLLDKFNNQ